MYFQVASKLAVTNAALQYSQAVGMAGGNAVYVETVAFKLPSPGTLRVLVQQGNDLENWESIDVAGSTLNLTAIGYGTLKVTGIASQYVRLSYECFGTGSAIAGAGINVANL